MAETVPGVGSRIKHPQFGKGVIIQLRSDAYEISFIDIGVRIIKPSDTLFGWIKVANVHQLTFTVQEFGSNKNITGMKELPGKMRIYPNPSFGKVVIESPVPEFDLVVNNQFGLEIMTRKVSDRISTLNLDGLSPGIYFVKIKMGHTVIVDKLIKQ